MFCGSCGNEVNPDAVACLKCGAAPRSARSFCQHCSKQIENANAVICIACGSSLFGASGPMSGGAVGGSGDMVYPSNPPKDPVLMAILSGCCIAGLGQIVLGQVIKGFIIMLVSMVVAVVTFGISIFITWPLGALDAYQIAVKLKAGKPVGQWEFF